MDLVLTRSQFVRWRTAIFAIFLACGLATATWASRVPGILSALEVDRGQLGLMLFVGGVASITGISISSVLMARFGARRSMLVLLIVMAAGVATIGIGADVLHEVPVVIVGLAMWGFGAGTVDIIMNVEGSAIENYTGKTILPLFHAFFSFGTVAGAGLGFVAIALGLGVGWHLVVIGVLILVLAIVSVANVPRREAAMDPEKGATGASGWRERLAVTLSAWKEPRTYALGIVMLGMSFAEGGANDWLALGVVQGHGGSEELGAIGLVVFSVSMTVVRVFGGPLTDRFGRVATLRVLSVAAAAGLLLFIYGPNIPLVLVGAALWGVGVSLGFPLGMSAAADDPAKAAARVSAAATIGYIAFLAGPPLLGLISEHIGLLNTLLILVGLIVASGLASPAARPIAGSRVGTGRGH